MTEPEIQKAHQTLESVGPRTDALVILKLTGDGGVDVFSCGSMEHICFIERSFQNFITNIMTGRIEMPPR